MMVWFSTKCQMFQASMNAVAQQALQFVANMSFVRRCRGSFWMLWSPRSSLLRLRDSLRVELGGVLVFTCPNGSGKTTVLKDLAVLMRRNDTFVAYIDCRLSKGVVSATECVYTSLGLTKEAARDDKPYYGLATATHPTPDDGATR